MGAAFPDPPDAAPAGKRTVAKRAAIMTKREAAGLFQAAKEAGYERARFLTYPDGRCEVVVEALRPGAGTDAATANEWDEVLK